MKFLLVTVAACATFASCIEKTEVPPIYISGSTLFVLQEETEDGTRYLPHIGFWYGGKEEFERGEILLNNVPMDGYTHNKDLTVFQINPAANAVDELADLNGTYTMNPIGVNGAEWRRSFDFEFTGDETLDKAVITEFKCENGKISATFDKTVTANARAYGFYLQPYSNGAPTEFYTIPMNQLATFLRNDAAATTQTVEFYLSGLMYRADYFLITPAAFNYSDNSMTLMRLAVGQDGTTAVSQIVRYEDPSDFSNDFTTPVEP